MTKPLYNHIRDKTQKIDFFILWVIVIISIGITHWTLSEKIASSILFTILVIFLAKIIRDFSEIKQSQKISEKILEITSGLYDPKDDVEPHEVTTFNDVISQELMRIRTDLVNIKVDQNNLGWDKINKDFLKMFRLYQAYPSCFLCADLEKPDDYDSEGLYQGMIIIALENDINIDPFWEVNFNSEILRKLNTPKRLVLKSGMNLSVFFCENQDRQSIYSRESKILAIEKSKYSEDDFTLTLEIDLNTVWDGIYPTFKEGKKLIRKFTIYTIYGIQNRHLNIICDPVQSEISAPEAQNN